MFINAFGEKKERRTTSNLFAKGVLNPPAGHRFHL
jgi:hypothetical protein